MSLLDNGDKKLIEQALSGRKKALEDFVKSSEMDRGLAEGVPPKENL